MLSVTKIGVLFNSVQRFSCCCWACCANEKTLQHQEHKPINRSHLRCLLAQAREEGDDTYEKQEGKQEKTETCHHPDQLLSKYAVPGVEFLCNSATNR